MPKPPSQATLDWVIRFISQVGFPIFVACYVLVRLEAVLTEVNRNVGALTQTVNLLIQTLGTR